MRARNDVDILREYDDVRDRYQEFARRLCDLVTQLLAASSVRPHSVTYRLKARDSLDRKLKGSPTKYGSLADITDICGLRVVTYFEDDVDAVSEIIEREFQVDFSNSVDKRASLDPDRFGYLSVHYVIGLSPQRALLAEYNGFSQLAAEIQIRSILQHAWAEMEHDLGYKSKVEVPRTIQRRFSRLAGLLELADHEFTKIRQELGEYEERITERIVEDREPVFVDKPSLIAFIQTSDILNEVDEAIAHSTGATIEFDAGFVDRLIGQMLYFDLLTVASLEEALVDNSRFTVSFATEWLKRTIFDRFSAGIGLFYLAYVLAAKTNSKQQVINYLTAFEIGEGGEESREDIADNVLRVFRKVHRKA